MKPNKAPNLGQQLWGALSACPRLSGHSPRRDRLWLVAQEARTVLRPSSLQAIAPRAHRHG